MEGPLPSTPRCSEGSRIRVQSRADYVTQELLRELWLAFVYVREAPGRDFRRLPRGGHLVVLGRHG